MANSFQSIISVQLLLLVGRMSEKKNWGIAL